MEKYKNRLRDLREDKDLTQSELATIFKLHLTQYRRYETGEVDLPTEWAKKFAKYYNVSIDYIANLISTPKPLIANKKELTVKQLALLENYEKSKDLQKAIDILLKLK